MASLSESVDIVWLRDDFRVDDQPAIHAAAKQPTLFVYIHDESGGGARPLGGAAKWRLAESLTAMEGELSARGARLDIVKGYAEEAILALAAAASAARVLWSRRYEGGAKALDARVEKALKAQGVEALTFNSRLMREPSELAKPDGTPVGIFKAFLRRHRALGPLPAPTPAPKRLNPASWPHEAPKRASIEALKLKPTRPDWSGELSLGESHGEKGALAALKTFVAKGLKDYADERDILAQGSASRLSANLRFGEISPHHIAHAVETAAAAKPALADAAEKYLAELTWRDFATALLNTHPDMATRCLRPEFERFPWRHDEKGFRAWARGRTGYPIVDAGMRQLWRTGYLPNRARLIVASFLVKHLLIDWRRGEEWFWDTLIDADPANNPLNWQWVAGVGVDSAPYFRIFNPVLQAEKFDPGGAYVRQWVPELERLEAPAIHSPWNASSDGLARAGIVLGETYPKPIVDHGQARARALATFAKNARPVRARESADRIESNVGSGAARTTHD
jgi:deoxyribodipyrimidine photo-lyase